MRLDVSNKVLYIFVPQGAAKLQVIKCLSASFLYQSTYMYVTPHILAAVSDRPVLTTWNHARYGAVTCKQNQPKKPKSVIKTYRPIQAVFHRWP